MNVKKTSPKLPLYLTYLIRSFFFIAIIIFSFASFFGLAYGHLLLRQSFVDALSPEKYQYITGIVSKNEAEYGRRKRLLKTRILQIEGSQNRFRSIPEYPVTHYNQDSSYLKTIAIPIGANIKMKVLKEDYNKTGLYFHWLSGWLLFREDAIRILSLEQNGKNIYKTDSLSFYIFPQGKVLMYSLFISLSLTVLFLFGTDKYIFPLGIDPEIRKKYTNK